MNYDYTTTTTTNDNNNDNDNHNHDNNHNDNNNNKCVMIYTWKVLSGPCAKQTNSFDCGAPPPRKSTYCL